MQMGLEGLGRMGQILKLKAKEIIIIVMIKEGKRRNVVADTYTQ